VRARNYHGANTAGRRGDVSVDIPAKQVRVTYDSTVVDIERVEAILAEEDYPVASCS
jgi:copper chaperone CopZ